MGGGETPSDGPRDTAGRNGAADLGDGRKPSKPITTNRRERPALYGVRARGNQERAGQRRDHVLSELTADGGGR